MLDDDLRHQGNKNGSGATSGEYKGECKATMLLKPGENGARIGELRGPVSHDPENKICEIKAGDIRSEKPQRRIGRGENHYAGKNDAAWRKAIEQRSDARGEYRDGDGGDSKRA